MSQAPDFQKIEPAAPAAAPPKKPSNGGLAGKLVLVLALLLGIGFAVGRSTAPSAASTPTGTSGPSASCLTAISEARKVITLSSDVTRLSSEGLGLVPDVLRAVQANDTASLNDSSALVKGYTAQIENDNTELRALDFNGAATACEAGK